LTQREGYCPLRRRRRRKRLSHLRVARELAPAINHTWAVDFVHDGLSDGAGRIRTGETFEHSRGEIVRNGGRLFGI
jgi:hypothetical protein